ncbi:hypothetical protein QR680_002054 [Steinernema hermaphroditum]|uniref:Nucleolar protein 16 n=1 Tax=Steinernema hermaphroditum TaxID=289476 RepID=A0AA39LHA9_9BILA|nr:hypothetical protein QR680_002054 [Steinernema hermaphroditum]
MRSMRHVRKGQKARAGKNRNAAKNRAHKRQTASKRVWLNKTQFWEPKVVIEEKYLAKVVVGSQESSSQVVEQTKAQKKAKVAVLNQKPSSSQVKDVRESTKKNQKEEVIAQKTTQQSQSANGVPGKKTDVKKTKVEEQLRVEIHEKQYTDNDDMKSSVDSGVDVDHKPAVTTKVAPVAAPVPVVAAPAAAPVTKVDPKRRERQYKLLPRDIQFCTYMMETHGDNYEAMANDNKNIYRDTANGIARKLRIFRESPQYEEYLQSKTA